jgi:hypothetical protein
LLTIKDTENKCVPEFREVKLIAKIKASKTYLKTKLTMSYFYRTAYVNLDHTVHLIKFKLEGIVYMVFRPFKVALDLF